ARPARGTGAGGSSRSHSPQLRATSWEAADTTRAEVPGLRRLALSVAGRWVDRAVGEPTDALARPACLAGPEPFRNPFEHATEVRIVAPRELDHDRPHRAVL